METIEVHCQVQKCKPKKPLWKAPLPPTMEMMSGSEANQMRISQDSKIHWPTMETRTHHPLRCVPTVQSQQQLRNTPERIHSTGELWFKQCMRDCHDKSRVKFRQEWGRQLGALRKAHREREFLNLECYCHLHSDHPHSQLGLTH